MSHLSMGVTYENFHPEAFSRGGGGGNDCSDTFKEF